MIRFALTIPALLVAGCATVAADEPAVAGAGECRNEALAQFTGQPATQELGSAILRESGAKVLQWIRQGDAVTMDFRADRVRVQLDGSNRVEAARCG